MIEPYRRAWPRGWLGPPDKITLFYTHSRVCLPLYLLEPQNSRCGSRSSARFLASHPGEKNTTPAPFPNAQGKKAFGVSLVLTVSHDRSLANYLWSRVGSILIGWVWVTGRATPRAPEGSCKRGMVQGYRGGSLPQEGGIEPGRIKTNFQRPGSSSKQHPASSRSFISL